MTRCRFSIPNDIWKWNLKPQGFAILVYLHYLHVHCENFIVPSADEIASCLHMSKGLVTEQISELNHRGLLAQNKVPMFECARRNFFSLANERFFLNIGHGAITVYAYLSFQRSMEAHCPKRLCSTEEEREQKPAELIAEMKKELAALKDK